MNKEEKREEDYKTVPMYGSEPAGGGPYCQVKLPPVLPCIRCRRKVYTLWNWHCGPCNDIGMYVSRAFFWPKEDAVQKQSTQETYIADLEMMLRICATYLTSSPGLIRDIENVLKSKP